MTTALDVLNVARKELGYSESSNNDNKFGRWFGMNFVAWCAQFVSWVAAMSGATDIIPRTAWTPDGAAYFQKRGQWSRYPKVGSIVYYQWAGMNRISHTGIVERVYTDGSWDAIEGNTNGAGSRTGGAVLRQRRRSVGVLGGFGHPAYSIPPLVNEGNLSPTAPVSVPSPTAPSAPPPPQPQVTPAPAYPGRMIRYRDKNGNVIRPPMTGQDVRDLQNRLNEHMQVLREPATDVDGVWGKDSDRVLRLYQWARHDSHNLTVDGIAGPATWATLWR